MLFGGLHIKSLIYYNIHS